MSEEIKFSKELMAVAEQIWHESEASVIDIANAIQHYADSRAAAAEEAYDTLADYVGSELGARGEHGVFETIDNSKARLVELRQKAAAAEERLQKMINLNIFLTADAIQMRAALLSIQPHLEALGDALSYTEQNQTVTDGDRAYFRTELEAHRNNTSLIEAALEFGKKNV